MRLLYNSLIIDFMESIMEFLLAADNVVDELDAEKISQDVSRLAKFTDSMVDKLINFGFSILVAIIIFVIGKIIIKFVRKFVKKLLLKSTVDLGVVKFIDSIIKVVGYVMVLIIICGEIGIQTTSFITLLGTGGLSIGLALQGSLANFAGGVLILVSKPFIIGDYVQICGEEGIVKKIDIIYTTLVKYDNRIIKCPNGEVANNTIINYSNEDGRRVDVKFSVHYDSDLANVKNVVRDIISKCPYTLKDRSNDVAITKLDDSAIVLEARVWVETKDYWQAYDYLNEHIKTGLDEKDIVIPYNQLDVHISNK